MNFDLHVPAGLPSKWGACLDARVLDVAHAALNLNYTLEVPE